MTIKNYFFNDSNGDRKYGAKDFALYFGNFLPNGVFIDKAMSLKVIANTTTNNTVDIEPGIAINSGYYFENDSLSNFGIGTPPTTNNRIDRIVIRLNTGSANRRIFITRIQGTESTNPIPPDVVRSGVTYDLAIADILRKPGVTRVINNDITDLRTNTNLCGFNKGLIEKPDTTDFFEDLKVQFYEWFDYMRGKISTNAETSLGSQIFSTNSLLIVAKERADLINDNTTGYKKNTPNTYVNLTPLNGTQIYREDFRPRVAKIGQVVYLEGAFTNILAPNVVVATLPVGYRPNRVLEWADVTTNIGGMARAARWRISTNGNLTMSITSDNQYNVVDNTFWYVNKTFILQ